MNTFFEEDSQSPAFDWQTWWSENQETVLNFISDKTYQSNLNYKQSDAGGGDNDSDSNDTDDVVAYGIQNLINIIVPYVIGESLIDSIEDLGDIFQVIEDIYICSVIDDNNYALENLGTSFISVSLGDEAFSALRSIVMGGLLFGDEISVRGYSLGDLLVSLDTVRFFEGPVVDNYGYYLRPDDPILPNSIRIDTDASLGRVPFERDSEFAREALFEVIIHEIAHAQDSNDGGGETPWIIEENPTSLDTTTNSLQNWAASIARRMNDFAREEGFDNFEDMLSEMEGNCGSSGSQKHQKQEFGLDHIDLDIVQESNEVEINYDYDLLI